MRLSKMGAKEEDGNDGVLGGLRDVAQLLQEITSQDLVPEVESNLGVDSGVRDADNGGENMLNLQLACLTTTYNALVAYKKKSDQETKNVPVSSGEAVPLSSEPSSSDLTNVEIKRVPIGSGTVSNDIRREQLGDSDLASKYNLPDDEEVTNPIDYSSSDYDLTRYLLQEHFSRYQLQQNFSQLSVENDDSKQYMSQIVTSSSDHLEAEHVHYGTHEHASDVTFGFRQPVNPALAPPQPSLQRQNAMRQQGYTSELDPRHSASALNQRMPTRVSITTASSHGGRPPISMTKALTTATDFLPKRNQQAMNPHYSQRDQVPSGQYGNITNSLYPPPNQNEGYNMPPNQNEGYNNMPLNQNEGYNNMPPSAAAFQQLGGTSNMAQYGNMITFPNYWRPEQNDSYNMPPPPQSAVSIVPYAYGSFNLFGTSSDNVQDSRFGYYDGGVSSNHLPSLQQHQSVDSNVWPSSFRPSQQQQQPWSDILASLNQQNDTSYDPSDQTQQRLWPRDN